MDEEKPEYNKDEFIKDLDQLRATTAERGLTQGILDDILSDEKTDNDDETVDAEFLDRYNIEIDEAEAEIDAGEYFTQDEVERFFAEKWKRINGN